MAGLPAAVAAAGGHHHGGGGGPRDLMRRLEVALHSLTDGQARVAEAAAAVGDLRLRLADLASQLADRVDLREVQESVVEHAAMYAKSPEVLGSMLKLVFCLDLVAGWLRERDARAAHFEERLASAEGHVESCNSLFGSLKAEVQTCCERAATLELAQDLHRAAEPLRTTPALMQPAMLQAALPQKQVVQQPLPQQQQRRPSSAEAGSAAAAAVVLPQVGSAGGIASGTTVEVSSLADEATGGGPWERLRRENAELRAQLQLAASASRGPSEAEESLKRENGELKAQLSSAVGAAEEAKAAAAAAGAAARAANAAAAARRAAQEAAAEVPSPPAAADAAVASSGGGVASSGPEPVEGVPPVQGLLLALERLEPLLASLPVGVVPGMAESQEEACDAYARLREVLLEAAATPGGSLAPATLPGQSCSRAGPPAWAAAALATAASLASACGGGGAQGSGSSPSGFSPSADSAVAAGPPIGSSLIRASTPLGHRGSSSPPPLVQQPLAAASLARRRPPSPASGSAAAAAAAEPGQWQRSSGGGRTTGGLTRHI